MNDCAERNQGPADLSNQALSITWYDLPSEGRDHYLNWLHQSRIPALLERPGILWAAHYAAMVRDSLIHAGHGTTDPAVPAGTQFILLIGAQGAGAFGNPTPDPPHAMLRQADKSMSSLRSGVRTNIMVEAMRVDGAASGSSEPGTTPAACIQLGSFNYPWQHEQELHAWFTQWRMPVLQTKPGCVRIRKLASVAGWAKHGVLYEWMSLEARNRDYPAHEDGYPEMQSWSRKVIARIEHAPPGSGALATRLWPPLPEDARG